MCQLHLWDLFQYWKPSKPQRSITPVSSGVTVRDFERRIFELRGGEGKRNGERRLRKVESDEEWNSGSIIQMFKWSIWSQPIILEEKREVDWSRESAEKMRAADSHLQSHLDSRFSSLLLPWQPDRRLQGGGRNEFLSLDRCRCYISAALFPLNDLLLTNWDERQYSSTFISVTKTCVFMFY